jgi:hypothetical protein
MQQIRSRHQPAYTCPSHEPFSLKCVFTDRRLREVNARPLLPIKAVLKCHEITSEHFFWEEEISRGNRCGGGQYHVTVNQWNTFPVSAQHLEEGLLQDPFRNQIARKRI